MGGLNAPGLCTWKRIRRWHLQSTCFTTIKERGGDALEIGEQALRSSPWALGRPPARKLNCLASTRLRKQAGGTRLPSPPAPPIPSLVPGEVMHGVDPELRRSRSAGWSLLLLHHHRGVKWLFSFFFFLTLVFSKVFSTGISFKISEKICHIKIGRVTINKEKRQVTDRGEIFTMTTRQRSGPF